MATESVIGPVRRAARAFAWLAASTAATALLGGCGGTSGVSASDRAAQSPVSFDDYARLGYTLDWRTFPHVTPGERVEQVVFGDDTIAALEGGSFVTLMEANDGSFRWRVGISNSLAVFRDVEFHDSRLLVVGDADLYMLDLATGTIQERQRFDPIANSPVVRSGDLLAYGANSGQLVGHLTAGAGVKFWGHLMSGPISFAPVLFDADNGPAVMAASGEGSIVFATADRGRLLGRQRMFAGPGAQPVAGDGLVFIGSLDQSVYAFAPDESGPVWRHRTERPIESDPAYLDRVVYIELAEAGMTAFNADDGSILWSNVNLRGSIIGTREGMLVAWDEDRRVMRTVDASTGDAVETVSLPTIRWATIEPFENGDLFTLSDTEVLARFRGR
ncbi:MAG: PQQ-binding-like beta-propeller repeat protein [Planctomycetota bacterium]